MMLAKIGKKSVLKSNDYFFEPKLDGYRALCTYKDGKIKFTSRNGLDLTNDFPELVFSLKKDCVIDGEIVMYDEKGNPSFSLIQRRAAMKGHASYVAFDCLEIVGKDIRSKKLQDRRDALLSIVNPDSYIQVVPSTTDGTKLWKVVLERKLEGVMAKLKNSKYTDGRSNDWLKIKNELSIDCVIVGYKTKVRTIASLSLGLFENNAFRYIGQVGTGFNDELLKDLEEILTSLKAVGPTGVIGLPKDVVPVKPKLVCEVKYLQLTRDIKLRAPVFLGLRTDKNADECTLEQVSPYA